MAGLRFRLSIIRTVALIRSQDARMRATMLTVLGLIITVVVGFGTIWYIRKHQKVAADDLEFRRKEKADKEFWAAKHSQAVSLVLQTDKRLPLKVGVTGIGVKWGYQCVFPDGILRSKIETYLVQKDETGLNSCLRPRDLDPDKFLDPTIKGVIQQTLDTVEQFKQEHPDDAAQLGL